MSNEPANEGLWVRSLAGAVITVIVASLFYAVAIGIVNLSRIGV